MESPVGLQPWKRAMRWDFQTQETLRKSSGQRVNLRESTPQRPDWIDPRRAPCGQKTRGQRDDRHDHEGRSERQRVAWAHLYSRLPISRVGASAATALIPGFINSYWHQLKSYWHQLRHCAHNSDNYSANGRGDWERRVLKAERKRTMLSRKSGGRPRAAACSRLSANED